jgi:hypothetical protein
MISFFFSFLQVMEHRWNEIDGGKLKYSGEKTCPSAILSTTNPTWTDPGSNAGLRCGYCNTVCIFFQSLLPYVIPERESKLIGCNATPTSEICTSPIFLSTLLRKVKYCVWGTIQWHIVVLSIFVKNESSV